MTPLSAHLELAPMRDEAPLFFSNANAQCSSALAPAHWVIRAHERVEEEWLVKAHLVHHETPFPHSPCREDQDFSLLCTFRIPRCVPHTRASPPSNCTCLPSIPMSAFPQLLKYVGMGSHGISVAAQLPCSICPAGLGWVVAGDVVAVNGRFAL